MMDLLRLAPHFGSADRAFEELCCQLAYADVNEPAGFVRIRGDGGDGGVECIWRGPLGEVHGWQAKYIPDLERALAKAQESLNRARARHPTLRRYVVCLPFDLSGSRGRNGTSQCDRWDVFKRRAEEEARSAGRPLDVELWSGSILQQRLSHIDPSGGRYRYWFDPTHLSAAWFADQIHGAVLRAGPRYNPELHHGHALDEALAALGDTEVWRQRCADWQRKVGATARSWASSLVRCDRDDAWGGPFPTEAISNEEALAQALQALSGAFAAGDLAQAGEIVSDARQHAMSCTFDLTQDLDRRHGKGTAGSIIFRHRQAELNATLPAANLDAAREVLGTLLDLEKWLHSPVVQASARRVLVLTGPAGIGKTHGLCDAGQARIASGFPTLLVDGRHFDADRDPWESLASALALDPSWTRDVLLDALDAAGAATGRVLLCIDALDERRDRGRWLDQLPAIIGAIQRRPNLALCVSVRDGYTRQVVREDLDLPVFEHPGFGDAVFDACAAFFRHYGFEPPVGPLLEPELSNPLFLRVLCETMKVRGLRAVPVGWKGSIEMFRALLRARDEALKLLHPEVGRAVVTRALLDLALTISERGPIPWSDADRLVEETLPGSQRGRHDLLNHLVVIGLLQKLPGEDVGWLPSEDRVDIAFGRLRHHLLADVLVRRKTDRAQLRERALADPGLAESLALILPEQDQGELVDLAEDLYERETLLESWIQALPWRAPSSLGERVEAQLEEALLDDGASDEVWDALLALALRPGQRFDHRYLHARLLGTPMPQRDGTLCGYLHGAYERRAPPSPLLRTLRAPWECNLEGVGPELRFAWCMVLGWCGLAADLRVRDDATRALVRLLAGGPDLCISLVEQFADVDDDAVLERVLLAAYGAVLLNPEPRSLASLARTCRDRVLHRAAGTPANALIRDHALCIAEWAAHRGVLPADLPLEDFRPPFAAPLKLRIPSKARLGRLGTREFAPGYPRLYESVMSQIFGDFGIYTIPGVLRPWLSERGLEKARRWVLGEVLSLGYEPALHAAYDHEMIETHGPGRAKPVWAERIGKKYQRIALARLVGLIDDRARARGKVVEGLASEHLRDLDPCAPLGAPRDDGQVSKERSWWEPARLDFTQHANLSDADWIAADDLPSPDLFVHPCEDPTRPGTRWRLLDGFFQWREGKEEGASNYRDAWMMIVGYLAPIATITAILVEIDGADFWGEWMPEGAAGGGNNLIGEYPWAPTYADLHAPHDSFDPRARRLLDLGLRPVANRLSAAAGEWESRTLSLTVPSVELVQATSTRYDGACGFIQDSGHLVFQSPASLEGGPSCLLVNDDDLRELRTRLGVTVLWTVLTERRVMGERDEDFSGMKHQSWLVWLDEGTLRMSRGGGEHILPDRSRRMT